MEILGRPRQLLLSLYARSLSPDLPRMFGVLMLLPAKNGGLFTLCRNPESSVTIPRTRPKRTERIAGAEWHSTKNEALLLLPPVRPRVISSVLGTGATICSQIVWLLSTPAQD